jgi:uncharacterized protein (DUF4415 family)
MLLTHSVELVPQEDGADVSEANWAKTRKHAAQLVEEKKMVVSLRINKDVRIRFVRRGSETFPSRSDKVWNCR